MTRAAPARGFRQKASPRTPAGKLTAAKAKADRLESEDNGGLPGDRVRDLDDVHGGDLKAVSQPYELDGGIRKRRMTSRFLRRQRKAGPCTVCAGRTEPGNLYWQISSQSRCIRYEIFGDLYGMRSGGR
jgi:hypothetical protein